MKQMVCLVLKTGVDGFAIPVAAFENQEDAQEFIELRGGDDLVIEKWVMV